MIGIILVIIVACWLALRMPSTTVACFLLAGSVMDCFVFLPSYTEDWLALGHGVLTYDPFLFGMGFAILLGRKRWERIFASRRLWIPLLLFGLWIILETVRNVPVYGASAFGELRFRYLVLELPIYVILYFDTPVLRRKLFYVLIATGLVIPLCLVPYIGFQKGWAFGEMDRFLPASASLSMMLSLVLLFLARRHEFVAPIKGVALVCVIPALFMVLADGHRSVWMTTLLTAGLLAVIGGFAIRVNLKLVAACAAAVTLVVYIAEASGLDVGDYVARRAVAYINPEEDQNSNWRMLLWAEHLSRVQDKLHVGEGFGGYWDAFIPELGIIVSDSPHSVYVQSVVKIGLIGLALYFSVVFAMGKLLYRGVRSAKRNPGLEYSFVLFGCVVLISSHAYYVVYALDVFALLYVGLGLSVVLNNGAMTAVQAATSQSLQPAGSLS